MSFFVINDRVIQYYSDATEARNIFTFLGPAYSFITFVGILPSDTYYTLKLSYTKSKGTLKCYVTCALCGKKVFIFYIFLFFKNNFFSLFIVRYGILSVTSQLFNAFDIRHIINLWVLASIPGVLKVYKYGLCLQTFLWLS